MNNKLTNNIQYKVISVLIACLIWLAVTNINDPESTQAYRNIPISFKNQETITNANKTYTVVDSVDKVSVYVTARKSVRKKLGASSFTVKADMENYNEYLGTVPLEVTCSNSHVGQENIRFTPSSIKITMEDKVEESFGIAATTNGKTEKGYELGNVKILNGDTVKVAGPQSLIRIISKITVPVDITGMSESSVAPYPIRIEDKNGAVLSDIQKDKLEIKDNSGIFLQDHMATVSTNIWKLYNDIPLEVKCVGNPAPGYRISGITITPKSVNLAAEEAVYEELEGKLVLNDTISIEGITTSEDITLDVNDTLNLYSGVRLEADTSSSITVHIEVEEEGSKTYMVPLSEFIMQNIPKDKKLIFSPGDAVSVSVRTSTESLKALETDDIKAFIDLKNCSVNGSYTLPVGISLPEGYELVNPVSIIVNIEDIEAETEQEAEAAAEEQ